VVADSEQEAASLEATIKKLPAVANVESLSRFLTENPTQKLAVIGEIKKEVSSIGFADLDLGGWRYRNWPHVMVAAGLFGYCLDE